LSFNYTKSAVLKFFAKLKKKEIKVPFLISVTKKKYLENPDKIIKLINNKFNSDIILRSSALDEDQKKQSNAGKYESIVLKKKNFLKLQSLLLYLINKLSNLNDELIIQEYISKPELAGVVFTKNPKNNLDYYILNFDTSKKTDLITSGQENESMKTFCTYKKYSDKSQFNFIFNKIKIIEKELNNNSLDIEFCIKKKKFFLLQARPLVIKRKIKIANYDQHLINIDKKLYKFFTEKNKKKITALSNMSDWNPAEMLGSSPKPLGISLYQELITDSVWSKQRSDYGYKDLYPHPLLYNIYNKPYIDLETDIYSFLPNSLNQNICDKIKSTLVKKLIKNKYLHDKIEFELIETCFNPNTHKNLIYLNSKNKKKYINQLKNLTKFILSKNILSREKNKIKKINFKINELYKKKLSPIQNIYFLIKICKEYGTLPFAGIARIAFICTNIVRVIDNTLNLNLMQSFYNSIKPISKIIEKDSKKIWFNKKYKINFLKKYGHIRPLMYSITSKNFSENLKNYFPLKKTKEKNILKSVNKKLSTNETFAANNLIKKYYSYLNLKSLRNITIDSIEQREYSKFIFSRCINEIFKNLIKLGKEMKINREELEYLDIRIIKDSYNNLGINKLAYDLKRKIRINKKNYLLSSEIPMPDFISKNDDIYEFETSFSKGNYFTNKITMGEIIEYDPKKNISSFKNKILLIENADPGYDFIFGLKLKGIITMYGGANSHISIRCLELNLPSCIGVGTSKYEYLKKAKLVELDCKNNLINIIK